MTTITNAAKTAVKYFMRASCYNPGVAHKPDISQRKADHIAVAASGDADFRARTTLLEDVHLVHQSLPERAVDEIDLTTTLLGRTLSAPVVVSGMTGGTDEAYAINRDIARAAQQLGVGFGVGSQRAMVLHPELEATFQVRDTAPDVFLLGNLGIVQARELGAAKVAELARRIGADAMAIHLNPAQELIQERGDRDFRGGISTLRNLVETIDVPIVLKETGCGLSPEVARIAADIGIRAVDVSGAGGTSWVAVEAQRASNGSSAAALGEELWDWGLPTAVSVAACAQAGLEVIATGGMRSGHDIARALALGATAGGFAAPVLRAHRANGYEGVVAHLSGVIHSIRTITLLCGCARVGDLDRVPRHIGPQLRTWLADLGVQ